MHELLKDSIYKHRQMWVADETSLTTNPKDLTQYLAINIRPKQCTFTRHKQTGLMARSATVELY